MQIAFRKQLARQAYTLLLILHGHLFTAHFARPIATLVQHLHAAHATAPAPATDRDALPAELLHGLEDVAPRRTGKYLGIILYGNYKFIHAHFYTFTPNPQALPLFVESGLGGCRQIPV